MTDTDDNPVPRESDTDALWQYARANDIGRREFLRLLMVGGAAAVIAACTGNLFDGAPTEIPLTPVRKRLLFKDPRPFILRGDTGLEARLENLDDIITPNRFFFVRNNGATPVIDVADWRLIIEGDAIAEPIELSYEDITRLPKRPMVSYLECAGNHRAMFDLLQGRRADGTQWMTGAIGNAEWWGVPLSDVLTLAGITSDAVSVMLVGLDADAPENGFRYVLPAEKAMHPDTMLAYEMNSEPLPRDHGYPLRAIVPGWVGSSHIKWLGRIVVSREQQWTRNNTTSYVLIGDDYPREGEARGQPVTKQVIKSALALSWPGRLLAGHYTIHGYAHSPHGPIQDVEWSTDGGRTWKRAFRLWRGAEFSWTEFRFEWEATPGRHTIVTRATDSEGNTQPDYVPFNEKGYLFNQPLPHPILVIDAPVDPTITPTPMY